MKDDLYLAKVQSLLNHSFQKSQQHILQLSAWHNELDQLWMDHSLMIKNYDQFNEEKNNHQLEKDKQWLEVVQRNEKLEIEISQKLENIRELSSLIPSDISQLTRYITQPTQNEEEIRKKVLKKMTEDMMMSYNQVRQNQQTSAEF